MNSSHQPAGADSSAEGQPLILISFLLPTRGRPEGVLQFLQSLVETTEELDQVEVVLGIDDDDLSSRHICHDRIRLKTTVFQPGLSMGVMNRACFDASCGRYVFLMNDDVVACTKGWDRRVRETFEAFGDDIALIHVNDNIFGDKLCTFPLLSRQACLEIGLCPSEYRRYKIDDHIMETYTLLERLGYPRIIYLEDVLFRHDNFRMVSDAASAAAFFAPGGRVYAPDQAVGAQDARVYEEGIEERKCDALKLAALIDRGRNLDHLALRLSDIHDPYCYRRRRVVVPPLRRSARQRSRVAAGLLTPDARRTEVRNCLTALKQIVGVAELAMIDFADDGLATRPHAMNRILAACDADFLLLLEDDVAFSSDLLEGLLACMDDSTAVVAPLYENANGTVASSGVYLLGQGLCAHADLNDRPDTLRVCQAVRSGALLIDMRTCRGLRFSPQYRVGGHDVDYCLQAWEAGYRVVCTPRVTVRRSGRRQVIIDPVKLRLAQEAEEAVLTSAWIDSGRLAALATKRWMDTGHVHPRPDSFARLARLIADSDRLGVGQLQDAWGALRAEIEPYPLFRHYAAVVVRCWQDSRPPEAGSEIRIFSVQLLAQLEEPAQPPGYCSAVIRKAMVRLTRDIRQRPFLMRFAMGLTRCWRDLMMRHDDRPLWVRRLVSPVVAKVEAWYEHASNVSATESLGAFAGYRLVKFDGLVCGFSKSRSCPEIDRQLPLRSGVVVATTRRAVIRKIERIHAACGIALSGDSE